MEKSGIAEAVKTETKEIQKPIEPEKYDVVFLNDHLTPMEFVIRVLKSIFNKINHIFKVPLTALWCETKFPKPNLVPHRCTRLHLNF